MAQVINWSDDAFIGLERFQGLISRRPDEFTPSLFSRERLARFEPGDCAYASFDAKDEYRNWYANPKDFARASDAEVVGDKITSLYQYFDLFDKPAWAGHDITVLHIVRNPADVAASYDARATNPSDSWSQDYLQGLVDWEESVRCAHRLATRNNSNVRFGVIDYDTVFNDSENALIVGVQAIFDFLRLPFEEKQVAGMRLMFKNGDQRRKLRTANDDVTTSIATRVSREVIEMHMALKRQTIS